MKERKPVDYSTTPLVDLLTQMAYLEKQIDMEYMREKKITKKIKAELLIYDEMRIEVLRRFPVLEKEECFQKKKLTLKRGK